jgi:UPF0042 nucleotide-binding protein
MQKEYFIVISGMSGSGKSVALNALEDLGYYCIDNLPAILLSEVAEKLFKTDNKNTKINKIAVSIDSRNHTFLDDISKQLDLLNEQVNSQIIFIDADDSILIKRYSETRRKHPLTNKNISLLEAIHLDRSMMNTLQERANIQINTSLHTPHQLKAIIRDHAATSDSSPITLLFQSFGFKYGPPTDVDFIFDVRCLPNPYWNESLREKTGLEKPVQAFLASHDSVDEMLVDILNFVEKWLPHFTADNRSYLTVGIGCTGGKHRSVYISSKLAEHFNKNKNTRTQLRHRELNI